MFDDLRITGRALNAEQLGALLRTASGASPAAAATAPTPTAWQGTDCNAHADCGPGSYCGFDDVCHPDRHAPKRAIESPEYQAPPGNAGFVAARTESADDDLTLEEMAGNSYQGVAGNQRPGLSAETVDRINEEMEGSRPIELGYESEEAAEEARRNREREAAERAREEAERAAMEE